MSAQAPTAALRIVASADNVTGVEQLGGTQSPSEELLGVIWRVVGELERQRETQSLGHGPSENEVDWEVLGHEDAVETSSEERLVCQFLDEVDWEELCQEDATMEPLETSSLRLTTEEESEESSEEESSESSEDEPSEDTSVDTSSVESSDQSTSEDEMVSLQLQGSDRQQQHHAPTPPTPPLKPTPKTIQTKAANNFFVDIDDKARKVEVRGSVRNQELYFRAKHVARAFRIPPYRLRTREYTSDDLVAIKVHGKVKSFLTICGLVKACSKIKLVNVTGCLYWLELVKRKRGKRKKKSKKKLYKFGRSCCFGRRKKQHKRHFAKYGYEVRIMHTAKIDAEWLPKAERMLKRFTTKKKWFRPAIMSSELCKVKSVMDLMMVISYMNELEEKLWTNGGPSIPCLEEKTLFRKIASTLWLGRDTAQPFSSNLRLLLDRGMEEDEEEDEE